MHCLATRCPADARGSARAGRPRLLTPALLIAVVILFASCYSGRASRVLTQVRAAAPAGAAAGTMAGVEDGAAAAAAAAAMMPRKNASLLRPPRGPPRDNCTIYIVAFGDSMADTGNVFNWSGEIFPAPPVYWGGRFADGPMWTDFLLSMLAGAWGVPAPAATVPIVPAATGAAVPTVAAVSVPAATVPAAASGIPAAAALAVPRITRADGGTTTGPGGVTLFAASESEGAAGANAAVSTGTGTGSSARAGSRGGCPKRKVVVLNYSYGGSTACGGGARVSALMPNLKQQVEMFLANEPAPEAPTVKPKGPPASPLPPLPANITAESTAPPAPAAQAKVDKKGLNPAACMAGLIRPAPPPSGMLPHSPSCLAPAASTAAGAATPATPAAGEFIGPTRILNFWIGHNDFLGAFSTGHSGSTNGTYDVATNVSGCVDAALGRLMAAIATPPAAVAAAARPQTVSNDVVIVWTLTPIETSPILPANARAAAVAAAKDLNDDLARLVEKYRKAYSRGPPVYLFNAHDALLCGMEYPMRYGFQNGTKPCVEQDQTFLTRLAGNPMEAGAFLQVAMADASQMCPRPHDFVWYDGMHFTSAAHRNLLAAPLAAGLVGTQPQTACA